MNKSSYIIHHTHHASYIINNDHSNIQADKEKDIKDSISLKFVLVTVFQKIFR